MLSIFGDAVDSLAFIQKYFIASLGEVSMGTYLASL